MKRVDQTIFTGDKEGRFGNCFQACVASILELPLEEVPHFCAEDDWWGLLTRWLYKRGLFAVDICVTGGLTTAGLPKGVWVIVSGSGGRGTQHAVIGKYDGGKDFTLSHDPHPDRAFLNGDIEYVTIIGKQLEG